MWVPQIKSSPLEPPTRAQILRSKYNYKAVHPLHNATVGCHASSAAYAPFGINKLSA